MPRSEVVKRMWIYFREHNLLVKQRDFLFESLSFSSLSLSLEKGSGQQTIRQL